MKNNQGKSTSVKAKPAVPAVEDKSNVLQVTKREGVSEQRQLADLATDGIASNAVTARYFLGASQPGLSITDMVNSLKDHGQRVNGNDLAAAEQMLMAQSVALNAIFAEMARRSALNMGQYPEFMERYMRLALKAQGQCRATVETLAAMKNPPVVFAKQANISNGHQQVNNGVMSGPKEAEPAARAHEETGSRQTKLLEETQHGGTVLDLGATTAATRGDTALEAVGAVHRAKKPRRQRQG